MHLLAAQAGALQQEGEAIDLAQTPGRYVFASSADSELAMLAAAADRAGEDGLRLASLMRLSHNYSVDLWCANTLSGARLIVIRLIGGAAYWSYGCDEIELLAREKNMALAFLPGDANPDPVLLARSTIPEADWHALHKLFLAGGPDNADAILGAFQALAEGKPVPQEAEPFPAFGFWDREKGITLNTPTPSPGEESQIDLPVWLHPTPALPIKGRGLPFSGHVPTHKANTSPLVGEVGRGDSAPHIPILFYRALIEGAGTATLEALTEALEANGLNPVPI